MAKITKVIGRQVFDSRGNPTIEAEVFYKNISATAICPSGASTGSFEAYEMRDKKNNKLQDETIYLSHTENVIKEKKNRAQLLIDKYKKNNK